MNLNNKSIIVVRSSGELLNHNLGNKINEFDVVVRLNNGITNNYEQYVGSKHDIWISGSCTGYYINMGNSKLQSLQELTTEYKEDILKQVKEVWILRDKHIHHKETDTTNFSRYNIKLRMYDYNYNTRYFDVYKNNGFKPTIGIVALKTLTDMVDKVYITGIDLYGYIFTDMNRNKAPYMYKYYYHNEKDILCPANHNPNSSCHKWQDDAKYIKKLIKEGKVEILKEDTEIEKSKMKKQIWSTCRICNKDITLYDWQDRLCYDCVLDKDNW